MADKYYEIPESPVYDPDIRALSTTDPANADTVFNPLFQQIINNVHAVKKEVEQSDPSGYSKTDHTHSGYVPTTRKVNGKSLAADIALSASDVGALPSSYTAPSVKSPLSMVKIYTNNTAGSFTFKPADYGLKVGDVIGVCMIGGGGSGGGICTGTTHSGASGGGSGHLICFLRTLTATDISSGISGTVGAGGAGKSQSVNNGIGGTGLTGNTGGTTTFGGVSATGGTGGSSAMLYGVGGQGSDTIVSVNGYATYSYYAPYGGCHDIFSCASASYQGIPHRTSDPPASAINWFEPFSIFLGAGGSAYSSSDTSVNAAQLTKSLTYGKGGSAVYSNLTASSGACTPKGNSATGYGNGGGAVACTWGSSVTSVTMTSGAGSDGVVLIYA